MPIMAPLADFAGVPRACVVTTYQAAFGWINLWTMTSAVIMGGLGLARVGACTCNGAGDRSLITCAVWVFGRLLNMQKIDKFGRLLNMQKIDKHAIWTRIPRRL
jgi:hypothetical protein